MVAICLVIVNLGAEQVLYMMDSFKEQQHPIMFAIIHILTTTGIRNEEFCTLQVQSLKEDKILGGYTLEVIGKGNKARSIPLKDSGEQYSYVPLCSWTTFC